MLVDRYLRPVRYDENSTPLYMGEEEEEYMTDDERRSLQMWEEDYPIEGDAYAWSGLAYALANEDIKKAAEETEGPVIVGDMGSSFPVWPQVLREINRQRCKDVAEDVVANCLTTFPALADYKQRFMHRTVLEGLVQDVLYHPPRAFDSDPNKAAILTDAFINQLTGSVVYYDRVFDADELTRRPHYKDVFKQKDIIPFFHQLEKQLGKDTAAALLADLAPFLAWECMPHTRRFFSTSLDIKEEADLREEAQLSFPLDHTSTEFYFRAQQLNHHVRGDINFPPYRDNSFTALTLFESYPTFFKDIATPRHLDIINRLVNKLKPNGRAIIFSWPIGMGYLQLEQHLKKKGEVIVREYGKNYLEAQMSSVEKAFAWRSHAFDGMGNTCSCLTFVKRPKAA